MVLLDGTAASEKGDEENDAANHDQQHGRVEKGVTQKVQVVAVDALNHASCDNQGQASDLKITMKKKACIRIK